MSSSMPPISVTDLRMEGWTVMEQRTRRDPVLHLRSSVSRRFVKTLEEKVTVTDLLDWARFCSNSMDM